jgi:hypothetical protein
MFAVATPSTDIVIRAQTYIILTAEIPHFLKLLSTRSVGIPIVGALDEVL